MGKNEWDDFVILLDKLDSFVSEESKNDYNEDEVDVKEFFTQIQVIQRMNAHFIFSLYTLIDFYTKSLIQDVFSTLPQERIFLVSRKLPKISNNPVTAIDWVLEEMKKVSLEFVQTLEDNIDQRDWKSHKKALIALKELRHKAAHQIPLISNEILRRKFPQYFDIVSKKMTEVKEEWKRELMPADLSRIINQFLEDLENLFFIDEIGKGIVLYLALIDLVVPIIFENK